MININEIYYEYMENTVDSEEKKEVDNKLKQALFVLSDLIDDAEATAEEQGFVNGYKQAMSDFNVNRKVEKKMIKKFVNNEDSGIVKLDEVLKNVKIENILDMLFMSDEGYQTISILIEDDQGNKVNYLMRATTAEEIVAINQVIRSFDLGITVEFVNFAQYDLFIDYCMNLIKAKREVTA